MVAKKNNEAVLDNVPSPEEELITLRNRVAVLEEEKKSAAELEKPNAPGSYTRELEGLRKGNNSNLNQIQVKEIAPKMVSLWHVSGHNVGKRVGPLQAELAEETFLRFAFFKIRLSSTRPTDEWIAEYKKTAEYKTAMDLEIKRRAGKNKSRSQSETERLIEAMAKQQGITKDQVVSIKDQHEVKGLRA